MAQRDPFGFDPVGEARDRNFRWCREPAKGGSRILCLGREHHEIAAAPLGNPLGDRRLHDEGVAGHLDAKSTLADRREVRTACEEQHVALRSREQPTDHPADRTRTEDHDAHTCSTIAASITA